MIVLEIFFPKMLFFLLRVIQLVWLRISSNSREKSSMKKCELVLIYGSWLCV